MTDTRITEKAERLPKWAQYYIRKLERDMKDLHEQIAALGTLDSAVTWQDGALLIGEHHGLPRYSTVKFAISDTDYIDVGLSIQGDMVKVYGSRAIYVYPHAANCVHLLIAK